MNPTKEKTRNPIVGQQQNGSTPLIQLSQVFYFLFESPSQIEKLEVRGFAPFLRKLFLTYVMRSLGDLNDRVNEKDILEVWSCDQFHVHDDQGSKLVYRMMHDIVFNKGDIGLVEDAMDGPSLGHLKEIIRHFHSPEALYSSTLHEVSLIYLLLLLLFIARSKGLI